MWYVTGSDDNHEWVSALDEIIVRLFNLVLVSVEYPSRMATSHTSASAKGN